jgi:NADH-quinone oxidoreductase subunit B
VEDSVEAAGVVDTEVAGRWVRVYPLGLACCAVELGDALASLPRWERSRGTLPPTPGVHALVVGGTVTRALVGEVQRAWEELPQPRVAVAFGACTISGGPYWDSYSVVPGIAEVLDDATVTTVPGCAPRPDTLLAGLERAVVQS